MFQSQVKCRLTKCKGYNELDWEIRNTSLVYESPLYRRNTRALLLPTAVMSVRPDKQKGVRLVTLMFY